MKITQYADELLEETDKLEGGFPAVAIWSAMVRSGSKVACDLLDRKLIVRHIAVERWPEAVRTMQRIGSGARKRLNSTSR